ncbi:winged helix-turn-helix domain-containing protein [Caulobacter hibisci]|uniref:Winged helix-turn-helix domain-containing protein n=1 Tax=Caulobacter hibisci TaxID=2035993 RepID=A0ABS0T438_9CAUL|nr:winged helix-turn-helix domain-containing protein [Caulobacter hibisci]MBI1685597.1 winged helix-turn-helix domain-containing protein [Caulobacter hibisci]
MTHAPTFAFGAYLFVPRRQLLLKSGQVVRVGSRALDLLAAFVQRPGELLTKRELLEEAWPSTTVVEGNLKVHIAALRRALDDDADAARYIATVNGRGYRFVAPVEAGEALTALPVASERPSLVVEPQSAPSGPVDGSFEDIITLLAQAMRSALIDLPRDAGPGAALSAPRRVLFIELTSRDEAWIEDALARRLRTISATR